MTIKKKLFISNILMIIVPVLASLLAGLICIGVVWFGVLHRNGLGYEDSEDFSAAAATVSSAVEEAIEAPEDQRDQKLSDLTGLLERSGLSLDVSENGVSYYAYGSGAGQELSSAASQLTGEGVVSSGGSSIYVHQLTVNGQTVRILLAGTTMTPSRQTLKAVMIGMFLILGGVVIISILITNRFLSRFVLNEIEDALDILSEGVVQIAAGNLDYRIRYTENDEFAPVCSAFNQMAQRLSESVEQTRKSEESRKEMMAGISHDLRTPLTVINAYTEGLLDGVAKTPQAQKKYLMTIHTKAEDIGKMVSQIFLFSKMDLDDYPVTPERISLDRFIGRLVNENKSSWTEKGLNVSFEPAAASVTADPAELRRVIENIVGNSIKYNDRKPGSMEITMRENNGDMTLTLADHGPGVPDEALSRLFDEFYRTDRSRRNPNQGSGLGLAIASKAVRRMHGTIEARRTAGGGLSILITLPTIDDDKTDTEEK